MRSRTLLFLLLLAACDSDPVSQPGEPVPEYVATLLAGDGQLGIAGRAVPEPLSLKVTTTTGRAVPGLLVAWSTNDGIIKPTRLQTDANGIASAHWFLGPDRRGEVSAIVAVENVAIAPLRFTAISEAPTVITILAGSNEQEGTVGETLPEPLRVRITRDGAPVSGATVQWGAGSGELITPATATTDDDGIATAQWRLGTKAGLREGWIKVPAKSVQARLVANGRAGPVAAFESFTDQQERPMCQGSFDRLWAYVTDRFGNRVVGQRVEWEVVSGQLVQLGGADPTLSDVDGNVFNRFAPAGVPGSAVVRATIPGSELSVEFILIATSVRRVRLDTSADAFRSCWNGSAPAVDTIAVGDSLTWELTPFDYDEHQLVTAGDSPLPAEPEFPYAIPTVVTLTFPEPGTYHYRDGYRSATGTLVVR